MAFINAQLDQSVKEPEAAPEGEYDLRIAKATRKESKNHNMMTEVMIVVEGEQGVAPVYHYLIDVNKDTPAQQAEMRRLELKRFLQTFGIKYDPNGYDDEDLPGATGRCMLIQEEGDDSVVRNKMRLPRLKG